nr:ATP-binding protein [Acanthopleuribacter pedis]
MSSVFTLVATAIQLYLDYNSDVGQLNAQMEQIDNSFVQSITDDVWNIDFAQVAVHLNGILQLPDVVYVRVEPVDFDTIAVGKPAVGAKLVRRVPLFLDKDGVRNHLGTLTVEAGMDGVYQRLRRRVSIVLVTQAIKTFLVSAFMLFIFNQILIRHLDKIAAKARDFSLDDPSEALTLERRSRQERPDELDDVVSAFNQMQSALHHSYQKLLENHEELNHHKENLEKLVEARTAQLHATQQGMIENAHQAGMAEIAIGVLHHIGNTLNSLNISGHVINETLRKSAIEKVRRATQLVEAQGDERQTFFEKDPRGRQLTTYYFEVGKQLTREHAHLSKEAQKLEKFIKDIKDTIFSQQEYAHVGSIAQAIDPANLFKEVLRLEQLSLAQAKIKVALDFQTTPRSFLPVNKIRFVMQQLLKNARDAVKHAEINQPGLIRVSLHYDAAATMILFEINDNGVGIGECDLVNIFRSGYSTKEGGLGFGLHACANIMAELGGALTAHSNGPGSGATFKVAFPVKSRVQVQETRKDA